MILQALKIKDQPPATAGGSDPQKTRERLILLVFSERFVFADGSVSRYNSFAFLTA